MGKYSVELNRTASTTLAVGVIQATATTPRRIKLYDWMFGSEAAAADNPFLWTVDKITAIGSMAGGSGVTPVKLDEADASALCDATEGVTTNPTIGGRLLSVPLNQRATMRWVAQPGSELVSPATDNTGFAIQTPTSSAVAVSTCALIEEQ
jgi:hypothetical protein